MNEPREEPPFSVAPNCYNGAPLPPPAQPYVPPEPPESRVRPFLQGQVVEPAAPAPEPEMDPGLAEYLGEKGTWLEWMDAMEDGRYHTPDEKDAYKRAQTIFDNNWRIRERTGRLHLGPGEGRPMPAAPTRKER